MSNKNIGIGMKGAMIALVLFAVAMGIVGFLTDRDKEPVQEAALQEPWVESLADGTQAIEAVVVPASAPSVPTTVPTQPEPSVQPTEVPSEPIVHKTLQTVSPVQGSTIGEYAMDCLSYNETTRDWRIHNGVDLAAEPGAPVCAAADGTVYTTYEDDSLGHTVVIRHEGGYTTRYSSLDEDLAVKAGDVVTMGQTIGQAGDSALVETVMGSHVHFSVSFQDLPMDPAEFLALS